MSRRSRQFAALLAATVSTGLTAGVFGDWAHSIMRGLATTDDRTFVGAFQSLDQAILNPLFLLTFLCTLVSSVVAVALLRGDGHRRALPWATVAAGLLLAAFVITMAVHEPLNTVLRGAGPIDRVADPAALRAAFDEARWTTWHIVRTVATTAAFGCLTWALVLHGRVGAETGEPRPSASRPSAGPAR